MPALPLHADDYIPYLRDVQRCETSLQELGVLWRVIEANAKMTCPDDARAILPMLEMTRQRFQHLERELVQRMVEEKVAEVNADLSTRARQVIDVMVRNLYERTADVGFLATDSVLCRYLVSGEAGDRAEAERRLRGYRAKYTVYEDILLIDVEGRVRAQIRPGSPVQYSRDPLIDIALESNRHVEVFRQTDLRPGPEAALIYAHRMCDPGSGRPLGVLCLVFDYASEVKGILESRADTHGRSLLMLVDDEDRVIASADPTWAPLGTRVPVHLAEPPALCLHAGRPYMVRTCETAAYQGYPGPPGWKGQAMVALDVAFLGRRGERLRDLAPDVVEGLLSHARTFSPPLHDVVTAAAAVHRVVWNGQVIAAGRHRHQPGLKNVLSQIGEVGARTDEIFANAIRDLFDTVLTARQAEARATTHMLVDLLDRNLYERANDCRWWARTPELRRALTSGPNDSSMHAVTSLLAGINRLYTVYARLVVYRADGVIVASSRPTLRDGSSVLGREIERDSLHEVLALADGQAYHMSAFRDTALYDGRPTFVFHAAIRSADQERDIVGGIGIVFDAEVEFQAMLQSLTVHREGHRTLYVNRSGRVIASTADDYRPGSTLELGDIADLKAGESTSSVEEHRGNYTLISATASAGYREYRTAPGHPEQVLAVSMQTIGEARTSIQRGLVGASTSTSDTAESFATFFVDSVLYALPAARVLEATSAAGVSPVALSATPYRTGLLRLGGDRGPERLVWTFDLSAALNDRPCMGGTYSQVIIVAHEGHAFGLQVDELHGVVAFEPQSKQNLPVAAAGGLVSDLIRVPGSDLLIQVLDVARVAQRLGVGARSDGRRAETLRFG